MRVFVGLIALSEAGKCEDKGGKCVDWRTEVGFYHWIASKMGWQV